MFKSSQEIRLNVKETTSATAVNDNENFCMFGKYQKTPDADKYSTTAPQVFISPELTNTSHVQLLHFPSGAVRLNNQVHFIIKRNGVKGNFEVKVETPSSEIACIPLKTIDPERLEVRFAVNETGLYKVYIKCNSVLLPRSPFIIVSISGGELDFDSSPRVELPIFKSDATKVIQRGLHCRRLNSNERHEFVVDASKAGNNILFVGMCGPKGQCDEVVVKHVGQHVYNVQYRIDDAGDYILAVKWGDDHIPGSPFALTAL